MFNLFKKYISLTYISKSFFCLIIMVLSSLFIQELNIYYTRIKKRKKKTLISIIIHYHWVSLNSIFKILGASIINLIMAVLSKLFVIGNKYLANKLYLAQYRNIKKVFLGWLANNLFYSQPSLLLFCIYFDANYNTLFQYLLFIVN